MTFPSTVSLYLFFLLICPTIAQTTSIRPRAFVLPLSKDSATGQCITQLSQRTPLVPIKLTVDLGGQFLWVDCEQNYITSTYKTARCLSTVCSLANAEVAEACGDGCSIDSPKPGCGNYSCGLVPENTITHFGTLGEVAQDVVSLHSTDGSNPGHIVSAPSVVFTSGSTTYLEGLANGVKGMAGLGRGPIGLPSQLASAFRFQESLLFV